MPILEKGGFVFRNARCRWNRFELMSQNPAIRWHDTGKAKCFTIPSDIVNSHGLAVDYVYSRNYKTRIPPCYCVFRSGFLMSPYPQQQGLSLRWLFHFDACKIIRVYGRGMRGLAGARSFGGTGGTVLP